ncbi:hypothetical protein BESB_050190 [Besnoitia besnoiti]|uniref:Uncharacterized protein n=1 Tax=Besnoitia besnoiti TaxID=94643 RepID=A0A2A9MM60_BESBE|nr:hypothetical protein BESB_050190 [Besnoitia besnoiti]PFH36827.1 hypothetical protein BESB_050190 [Besnoitia besnoiti]
MSRGRLGHILKEIFIVKPTGLSRLQSGIMVVSAGYLGYVWYVDGCCPFLPSKDARRLPPLFRESEALIKDSAEERLARELGVTTFKEWKERGFIPDSPPASTEKD